MLRIPIHGNTPYYRERQHAEVLGVVDSQGDLWLKDVPDGENLWNQGRFIGLCDKKFVETRQRKRRSGLGKDGGDGREVYRERRR